MLRDAGFDVQILGFGEMKSYAQVNERIKIKSISDGWKTIIQILATENDKNTPPETEDDKKDKEGDEKKEGDAEEEKKEN